MKAVLIFCAVFGAHAVCVAQSCEKMEYAQLKDSTKKELSDQYCMSMLKADLHDKLGKTQLELYSSNTQTRRASDAAMAAYKQHGDEQVACMRAAGAASDMLQKKFKAKPACPKS